jgi:uncharacterized protein (TIGR02246 family)
VLAAGARLFYDSLVLRCRTPVVLAALAIVCVAPAAESQPGAPGELLEHLMAADNAGDLEGVLRLYASDAVLLPPNEPAVRGRAAIRERYRQMFAATRMRVTFTVDDQGGAGDVWFIRGRTAGARRSIDGSSEEPLAHKFVMILKRDAGAWRISSLIWNADR